jgi:hypothetical protein
MFLIDILIEVFLMPEKKEEKKNVIPTIVPFALATYISTQACTYGLNATG